MLTDRWLVKGYADNGGTADTACNTVIKGIHVVWQKAHADSPEIPLVRVKLTVMYGALFITSKAHRLSFSLDFFSSYFHKYVCKNIVIVANASAVRLPNVVVALESG